MTTITSSAYPNDFIYKGKKQTHRTSNNFTLHWDYATIKCPEGIAFLIQKDVSMGNDFWITPQFVCNGQVVDVRSYKGQDMYISDPQNASSVFTVQFEPFERKRVKDMANWMRDLPNKWAKLSELSIPGTHDSGTKGISGIGAVGGRCQNSTIERQLNDGIRFLDIRLNNKNTDGLIITHDKFFCGLTFNNVLDDCKRFLSNHESEIILMSVKEEDCDGISPRFEKYLDEYGSLFYFTSQIPTVQEAKGKIVLFYRFEFKSSKYRNTGIRLGSLKDNNYSYYENGDNLFFYVEDFYKSYDTHVKRDQVREALDRAASGAIPGSGYKTDGYSGIPSFNTDIFYITFNSIAMNLGKGTHTPYDYAWGDETVLSKIDPIMNQWLKGHLIKNYGNRRLGVILMDFYNHHEETNELTELIVEQQIKNTETKPIATIVYKDGDYKGQSYNLVPGDYPVLDSLIGNDSVSSLKVVPGYKVTLYEHVYFVGSRVEFTSDTSNVGGFNDKTSSIKVEIKPTVVVDTKPTEAIVYKDVDYRGESCNLAPGNYPILDSLIGNDCVSSLKVAPGYKVTLYEHIHFAGISVEYLSDTSNIGGFNDKTSSIKVEEVGAIVFEHGNFGGKSFALPVGDYSKIDSMIPNDTLSSLKVTPGYKVFLYENYNFGGKCVEYTTDTSWVGDFNDRTSSIKVVKI